MRGPLRSLAPLAGVMLVALLAASPAAAKRDIKLGFSDDVFADNLLFQADDSERAKWARRFGETNAEIVRLNVHWARVVSTSEPADPTDPDQPAYDWSELDRAVRAVVAEDQEPLFTVLTAPRFAEGKNRPSDEEARPGTWKPDGEKLRQFAVALATRYSGSHPDPEGGSLPRVRYYEGWNEPNLHRYITPQRTKKGKNLSPDIYRELLNGFYEGIKSVSSSNVVVGAGTGPFGERRGKLRIPPLEFWRDVFCLKNRKKLKFKKAGCPKKSNRARLDIFAHNSISEPGKGPDVSAQLKDNATTADMHKLVDVIRAAEKRRTVRPGGKKREVWGTELWFESKPPEKEGVGLKKHARRMAEAMYLLWKQKVSAGIFLQLRDSPYDPKSPPVVGLQSGVYFINGKAKPALDAARFPFVADREKRKKVIAWGKAPGSGKLKIEKKRTRGGWMKVAKARVDAGEIFKKKLKLRGKQRLRASVDNQKSIEWKVGRK